MAEVLMFVCLSLTYSRMTVMSYILNRIKMRPVQITHDPRTNFFYTPSNNSTHVTHFLKNYLHILTQMGNEKHNFNNNSFSGQLQLLQVRMKDAAVRSQVRRSEISL